MAFDLLIKNGTIVTSAGSYKADVAVQNEKIVEIAKSIDIEAKKVVDASGKLVLPGGIDAHTHLQMPFGNTISSDSYESGTRSAACGGVTTIFDYPVQPQGTTIIDTVNAKKELLEKDACVDYASHCCITDLMDGKILEEMEKAVDEGITSYKVFLVYKKEGWMVDDSTLAKLMLRAKELGAMVNVHAENPDMIDLLTEKYLSEGKTSPWYHYLSRQEFVEAEADKRVAHWAKHLNAPVYIVHLANKEGLEAAIDAKLEGAPLFIETCPQYLEFTSEVYKREDGQNFVCSPPIKGQESQDALWMAVKNGLVDTVATDHCPFTTEEKSWGKDDYTKIPNGVGGVEVIYPFMLDAANRGEISFERAVALCSTNVARIFGCDQKGEIAVGKDADIVIYDKDKEFTVSIDTIHTACDHTVWEGKKLHGYPIQTYLRGHLVYDNGKFVGEKGMGKFIKRVPVKL